MCARADAGQHLTMTAALTLPQPPLYDTRVRLREWCDADVSQIVAGFGHPSVLTRSWALTRPYTTVDARDYLAADRLALQAGTEIGFAIADPADEARLLGGGSLYDVDRVHRRAAIGYWLAPGARGRGCATSAVALVADWAVGPLGLERLEITCAPDNEASCRVAQRAGFSFEARLRSHLLFKGERRDTLVFARVAPHPAGAPDAAARARLR